MGQANFYEIPGADTFGWDDATGRIRKLVECATLTWNQESQGFTFHRKKNYFLKILLDKCKKWDF